MNSSQHALEQIRSGGSLSASEQYSLILRLSLPAILAQVASTLMQLIDASMAGQLGALAAASIGLVASSTWLFSGVCRGVIFGFSVQTAQTIGAGQNEQAARVCRQGLISILLVATVFCMTGMLISGSLPVWLGGEPDILAPATGYFRWWCAFLPFLMLNEWAVQMLQATGNTRLPGTVQVIMCGLDVVFNWLFIFRMGLGVAGAAIGTGAAALCASLFLAWFTLFRAPFLSGRHSLRFQKPVLKRAFTIGLPVSLEQLVTGSGYVIFTRIVASLGSISVAANSFGITAESLCYMPGFGIQAAASAIIGQCTGARRKRLTRKLAWRIEFAGIAVMTVMGVALWFLSPALMSLLTPDAAVQALGARVLRIEAFAEPMYGAAIVATGILRGKGDTLWPTMVSLVSNWGLRIPLAASLVSHGLPGVWFAMAFELCVRGLLFLAILTRRFPRKQPASSAEST